jgi:outer membrane protein TolC
MTISFLNSVLRYAVVILGAVILGPSFPSSAQTSSVVTAQEQDHVQSDAPLILTLRDALERAKKINPEYRAAQTEYGSAKEDRVQSRAALLPNVNYNANFTYTEGGGTLGVGRFIANNGVHEYVSQGNVHQNFSLGGIADYRRTVAAEALARARAEIAVRGLVVTVTQTYYGFVTAQRKYSNEQRAASEAEHFFDISQKLEHGGEVAHSDVIKAQIQMEQVQRDLRAAELEINRSHLELAVLVFPDFNENFAVVDDLQTPEALPSFAEVLATAANKNPEIRAAVATLQAARQAVVSAWNGFLPSLSLDYFYGIDANHFAVNSLEISPPNPPREIHNLGYAASATLQFPVWNWGASRSKLKQANLRRDQANVELSFAQRQLLANMRILYSEAQAAQVEMESLNRSAELAAEGVRLANLRYQSGEALVLEVVDAQNTLTQALNAFNDGQVRFRVAVANLQTLTGSF